MNRLFIEYTDIKEIKATKNTNGQTIPYFVFNQQKY